MMRLELRWPRMEKGPVEGPVAPRAGASTGASTTAAKAFPCGIKPLHVAENSIVE